MDLSIVIVNWNTREILRECLYSIYKTIQRVNFEIIIVDNASVDGSVEMIKSDFKNVILIQNNENYGFAKANNIAFPIARGKYILMLNSDTFVLADAIDLTIDFLDKNLGVGALTPKIFNSDGSIQHPCYVKEPSIANEFYDAFSLGKILKLRRFDSIPAANKTCDVAHACGCSLFIRKSVLEKVGYLDERLIFSFEDADICMRIRHAKWRIVYFPDSHIIHYGGLSRIKSNGVVGAMLQSKYVFYGKYHGAFKKILLAIFLTTSSTLKAILYTILSLYSKNRQKKLIYVKYYWAIVLWHFKFKKSLINRID
jgi:GT2 family glycosyltransferase